MRLKTFLFGAPYYPEHWSPVDRERDAERMAAAGVNVVRMATAQDVRSRWPDEYRY